MESKFTHERTLNDIMDKYLKIIIVYYTIQIRQEDLLFIIVLMHSQSQIVHMNYNINKH